MKIFSMITLILFSINSVSFAQSSTESSYLDSRIQNLTVQTQELKQLQTELNAAQVKLQNSNRGSGTAIMLLPLILAPRLMELGDTVKSVIDRGGKFKPVDVVTIALDGILISLSLYAVGEAQKAVKVDSATVEALLAKVNQKTDEIEKEIKLLQSIQQKIN